MSPIIGVTRCSRLDDYIASIEAAGAAARILEVTESPRSVVGEVDGVLLTGGGDVDPVFYEQERHPAVYDAEPGRDEFEIDLARRALDGDLPLFAICRGMQVLNVAAGGTLIQDIPTQIDTPLRHAVDTPKDALAHVCMSPPDRRWRRLWELDAARPSRCPSTAATTSQWATSRRTCRHRHRAGRHRRSDRTIRARPSASASSGIRKTSGAPASSSRCSRRLLQQRGWGSGD